MVTIIIMEAFINKMRRLKGVRKQLIVEEAWKALSSANMADYLRYMYKRSEILRRGDCGDAGGGRHHLVAHREGKHHQQLGLQDTARPKKIMNRFDQIQGLLGADGKGEVTDTLHQPVQ